MARPPTTRSSARTPDTTLTCGFRPSVCSCPRRPGPRLLDAGCGTGASTAALLAAAPRGRDHRASTRSAGMLARRAPRRGRPRCVSRTAASRTSPSRVDGPFDGIFAAYLIRNLADPDAHWHAFRRCCGPAGRWRCTILGARLALATSVWNTVCATSSSRRPAANRRRRLYRYLRRSVNRFDGAAAFRHRLREQRVRRSSQRDDARLAAKHRAHLPGAGAPMTDRRRVTHAARRAARRDGAARTSACGGGRRGIAGLAAATGLAERGVTVDVSNAQPISAAGSADGRRRSPTARPWP